MYVIPMSFYIGLYKLFSYIWYCSLHTRVPCYIENRQYYAVSVDAFKTSDTSMLMVHRSHWCARAIHPNYE